MCVREREKNTDVLFYTLKQKKTERRERGWDDGERERGRQGRRIERKKRRRQIIHSVIIN